MSISFAGIVAIRPVVTGRALPLILRNPQNDNTKIDYQKDGPTAFLKFGTNDYRAWVEALTDQTGLITNYGLKVSAPDGFTWSKNYSSPITPIVAPNWEKGEFCPTTWIYESNENLHKLYYHGGNNPPGLGPRQICLMTSPRASAGEPGTWNRFSATPILTPGGAGAWDELSVADAFVWRRSATDYRMLYKGFRVSDSKAQIGLATSVDGGYTWTKYVGNPVVALGAGNITNGAYAPWGFEDELGRLHIWYTGISATNVGNILYGFSDNLGQSFTSDPTQVIIGPQGATAPDFNIGDTVSGFVDEGWVIITIMNFNFSGYTGDALGRLEGRGLYYLPKEAAVVPARPGRAFMASVANSRCTVNASAKLLNSSIFSIYAEFKVPPGGQNRSIYTEEAAFNKEIYVRINTTGFIEAFYRTPSGIVTITGATRVDNNQFHRVLFRRTALNAFELFLDGVSVGTSATNPSIDATAAIVSWGNWTPTVADEPLRGILRRGITTQGSALTNAQSEVIWNAGAGGIASPLTPINSVKFGSGFNSGSDAAEDGASFGVTVTAGTKVVDAERTATIPTDAPSSASDGITGTSGITDTTGVT